MISDRYKATFIHVPKIALCLHGYFNSLTDTTSKGVDGFQHLYKHVLSKEKNVDIYMHSWSIKHKEQILNLYGPYLKAYSFTPQINFSNITHANNLQSLPRQAGYCTPETIFSHFYSLQQAFSFQMLQETDYDIVIKSRFDIGRINRGGTRNRAAVQCINFNSQLPMDKFYMADWGYLDTEGPADMWFYSNKDLMMNFANIYDFFVEYLKPGSSYHKWADAASNGMINTIKAYKWFMIQAGIWDNKSLLQTTWE